MKKKKKEVIVKNYWIVREMQKISKKLPGKWSVCIGTFESEKEADDCKKKAQKKSGMSDGNYMIIGEGCLK